MTTENKGIPFAELVFKASKIKPIMRKNGEEFHFTEDIDSEFDTLVYIDPKDICFQSFAQNPQYICDAPKLEYLYDKTFLVSVKNESSYLPALSDILANIDNSDLQADAFEIILDPQDEFLKKGTERQARIRLYRLEEGERVPPIIKYKKIKIAGEYYRPLDFDNVNDFETEL